MKRSRMFLVILLILPIFFTTEGAYQPKYSQIPMNASTIVSYRANSDSMSYGFYQSESGGMNIEPKNISKAVAEIDQKWPWARQGQTSTDFGIQIAGWKPLSDLPQYSRIYEIRVQFSVKLIGCNIINQEAPNAISNLRAQLRVYSATSPAIIYTVTLCNPVRSNGVYTEIARFTQSDLINYINSGWRLDWIRIVGYSTYRAGFADLMYMDQLLVDYLYEPPTPPSAPTLTRISEEFDSTVAISWTQPASNAPISFYKVYRNGILITTTTARSYTDTTEKQLGFEYRYTVVAVSAIGESVHSNGVTVICGNPPPAPSLVSVTQTPSGNILNWTAPSQTGGLPITEYRVYRSINGSDFLYLSGGVTSLGYIDASPLPDTQYQYTVSAKNARGESVRSNELGIRTQPWIAEIKALTPNWISDTIRYTAASSITLAIDRNPLYSINSESVRINGTAVQITRINNTRVTVQTALKMGKNILLLDIMGSGQQSYHYEFMIERIESIQGIVFLDPPPINYESVRVVSGARIALRCTINNLEEKIDFQKSYIRIQSGVFTFDVLNQLVERTGSINASIDLIKYILKDGLNSLAIYLVFTDGTYFTDYLEFWVDNRAPILSELRVNFNLSIIEFKITEEFPTALTVILSAADLDPIEFELDTKKQFGFYSGFTEYLYSYDLNTTILTKYRTSQSAKITVFCFDVLNQTGEFAILITDPEYTPPLAIVPSWLAGVIGAVSAVGAGAAFLGNRIKNTRARQLLGNIENGTTRVAEKINSLKSTLESIPNSYFAMEIHDREPIKYDSTEYSGINLDERFGEM